MLEEIKVLKDVCERLNKANILYMLSGSVAMNYYAEPRMTRDIDIVIVLNKANVEKFTSIFAPNFYVDEEMVRTEISRSGMFNILHNESIIKVDFILKKDGEFNCAEFERRRQVEIEGVKVWIVSPEDLVISKLNWAKDSLSEMQFRDVKTILNTVENLDMKYVSRWAKMLGVSDLLGKLSR